MLSAHALSTAVGLLVGFAVVWWVSPDASGAVFLVLCAVLICNVIGAVARQCHLFLQRR
jgi:hypothetical protein